MPDNAPMELQTHDLAVADPHTEPGARTAEDLRLAQEDLRQASEQALRSADEARRAALELQAALEHALKAAYVQLTIMQELRESLIRSKDSALIDEMPCLRPKRHSS